MKIFNQILNFILGAIILYFGLSLKKKKYIGIPLLILSIVFSTFFFFKGSGDTPITFAAIQTFGQTSNNASTQTNSSDRKYVNPATAGASGLVVSGVARIWNGGTVDSSSNLVIYTNISGNCATTETLLAVSDTFTITTAMNSEAARSYTFSGANQIAVVSGTSYCIGVHFSDPGTGNISISRANTVAPVRSDFDTYSDGPTATCSCTTSSNGPLDLYIEFDDAVGGGGGTLSGVIFFQ